MLALYADATLSAGTFTITFDGQTTIQLSYDATADQVAEALESLPNINSVSVTFEQNGFNHLWSITFLSDSPLGIIYFKYI